MRLWAVGFSIIFFCVTTVHGQTTTYGGSHAKNQMDAHAYYFPLKIEYDFGFQSLTQQHWEVDYITREGLWGSVAQHSYGSKMSPLDKKYLEDIGEEIDQFARNNKYNSYNLLSLIVSITNSMQSQRHALYKDQYYYFPYELVITGIHKGIDRHTFMAGLLSLFCFDLTVVITDQGMYTSVLTQAASDVTHQDRDYLVLENRKSENILEIIPIEQQCSFQNDVQKPVSTNFKHALKEYKFIGNSTHELAQVNTQQGKWSAAVRISDHFSAEENRLQNNMQRQHENKKIIGYWITDNGGQLEAVSNIYR